MSKPPWENNAHYMRLVVVPELRDTIRKLRDDAENIEDFAPEQAAIMRQAADLLEPVAERRPGTET